MGAGNQIVQIFQGSQFIQQQQQQQQQHQQQTIQGQQLQNRQTIISHSPQPQPFNPQQQQQQQQQFLQQIITSSPSSGSPSPSPAATVIIGGKHHQQRPQQILPKPVTPSVSPSPQQSPQHQPIFSIAGGKTIMTQPKTSMAAMMSNHHQMPAHIQVTQTTAGGQQYAQQGNSAQQQQQPQLVATPQTTPTGSATQGASQNGGSIILPTGNINAQPLLLNQMPVIVQQNTPQGVQLILRPPTPQLATPSLVIHNTRPQLQQPQPQQVLRILGTNGAMQLAAAPTFIVSSQGNLVQQNIPGLKTNQGVPLTQIQGLQGQRGQAQQIAINQHLLSQGVAQLQNLQLNGNLTQIQVPNGLNGQLQLASLPAQFQQAGFSLQNQNINLNQLGSANFTQQLAAAAAASGATFTSPPPPAVNQTNQTQSAGEIVVSAQNIQFTSGAGGTITVNAPMQQSTQPQGQIISDGQQILSPEPIRQPTPILTTASGQQVILADSLKQPPQQQQHHQIQSQQPQQQQQLQQQFFTSSSIQQSPVQIQHQQPPPQPQPKFEPEKPKKERKSKKKKTTQPPIATAAPMIATPSIPVTCQAPTPQSEPITSPPTSPTYTNTHTSTGKLDLANLMKISGIGIEDDDFMDTDEPAPQPPQPPPLTVPEEQPQPPQQLMSPPPAPLPQPPPTSTASTDIMITIPASAAGGSNVDFPYTISIPSLEAEQPKPLQPTPAASSAEVPPKTTEPPPFMITIDASADPNSAQPYTISIPRLSADDQAKVVSIATVAPTPTIATVTSSSAGGSLSQNTICVNSLMNNVLNNTQVTPTLQSQINEIQNQLIQAAASSAPPMSSSSAPMISQSFVVSQPQPMASFVTSTAPMVTSTLTSPVTTSMVISPSKPPQQPVVTPTKKKSGGGKKNGKKLDKPLETIPVAAPVPTQIGNIQISQIDGTTVNNNKTTKGTINNQIQITPILDNKQNYQPQPHPVQQQPIQAVQQPQPVIQAPPVQPQPVPQPPQPVQQQPSGPPSAQSILSQLTGALSLSLAENGHLILKHDVNSPQDNQSQMILQAILSGALGNVSLVNEPSKPPPAQPVVQPPPPPAPIPVVQQQPPKSVATVSGQIQHKNVIVTSSQHQYVPSFNSQTSTIVTSTASAGGHLIQHHQQQQPPPQLIHHQLPQQQQQQQILHTPQQPQHLPNVTQSLKEVRKHEPAPVEQPPPPPPVVPQPVTTTTTTNQFQPQPQQQQQTVVINSNAPKFVELPKVGPNSQLFSLNTLTNQITQMSPGQTTAALGPMERLLIVPTGINAAQLAQCLLQGQIHFNNIGPVQPTSEPPPQPQPMVKPLQQPPQIVSQNFKPTGMTAPVQIQNKVVNNVVPVPKEKPKRSRSKKADKPPPPPKASLVKVNPVGSGLPPNVILQPGQHAQPILAEDGTKIGTKIVGTVNPNNFVVASSAAPPPPIAQVHPQIQSKIKPITTTTQCNNLIVSNATTANVTAAGGNLSFNSSINSSSGNGSVNVCVQPNNVLSGTSLSSGKKSSKIQQTQQQQHQPMLNQMPPLVSVNSGAPAPSPTPTPTGTPSVVPRVQTIQLTPQKQQLLKSVQQQIQQLSAKLQNKNLLATLTIPADFDPTNPVFNKPLPVLTNIQNMADPEITQALQRLFIEQQKILATGKIIPTIPSGHALAVAAANPPPPPAPISGTTPGGAVISSEPKPPQQAIVSPITVTPTSANAAIYQGGANMQTIPSPIQINSPQVVKQDIPPPPTQPNYTGTIVSSSGGNSSMSITITNSGVGQIQQPLIKGGVQQKPATSIIPIGATLPPQTSVSITQPNQIKTSVVKQQLPPAPHQIILNNKSITLTSGPTNSIPMPSLVPTQQSMSVTKIEPTINRSNTPVPPPLVPTSMPVFHQGKNAAGQSIMIVGGSPALQNVKTSMMTTASGGIVVQANPSLHIQLQQPQQPMNIVPPPLVTMSQTLPSTTLITTAPGSTFTPILPPNTTITTTVAASTATTLTTTTTSSNIVINSNATPTLIPTVVPVTSAIVTPVVPAPLPPPPPPPPQPVVPTVVTTTIPGSTKPVVVPRSSL